MFSHPLGWRVDPYISASLRTSITESFYYAPHGSTRLATFWDPVTSQQSAGFSFGSFGSDGLFMTRLGVTLQQIRSHHHTRMTDDSGRR